MTGPVFVDTNVLVYDRDRRDPLKQEAARAWMTALWRSPGLAVVSSQVLGEFYWTVTRKLRPGLEDEQASRCVRALLAWELVTIDQDAFDQAWTVQDRFGLSFWDALVVAAARLGQCRILLTEDLQDGQDFGGVVAVNPFRHPASDLTAA